jgi:hypothetical protein
MRGVLILVTSQPAGRRELMRYRTLLIIPVLIVSVAVAMAGAGRRESPDQQVERTTAANPEVVLSVCLGSGSLSVQVWDRNQVRVRSSDGLQVELRRPVADSNSEPAKELALIIGDSRSKPGSSCVPFGDIKLDVPPGTSLRLQTRDADVNVSGVARVDVVTQGGTVNIQRVTRVVNVRSIGGNISVQDAKGAIRLHSVGGSIDARNVAPSAAGDICEAGTVGGDITLAQISHEQVKVSTVNGDVSFSSSLAPGGHYSFQAIGGALSMSLPADSSFRLNANLGRGGEVNSDFPLRSSSLAMEQSDPLKRHGSKLQHLDAVYGSGDALINLSSFGGSIWLRKK